MKFCPECDYTLYPQEDLEHHVLVYACRRCNIKQQADTARVYVNNLRRKRLDSRFAPLISLDPSLRRQRVECPKCHHYEAVVFAQSDERMEQMFVCTNLDCEHYWS